MVLAHGGHFAVYMFPVLAAVVLFIVLRGDARTRKQNQQQQGSSVPSLPRSELSRQVWKATKPPRATRRAAAPKPKFAPLTPTEKVAPFRPPRERDRREA